MAWPSRNIEQDLDRLEAEVRRIAREDPEHIYEPPPETIDEYGAMRGGDCSYLPDDNNPQGCLIGAALRAVGVTPTEDFEGNAANQVIEDILATIEVTIEGRFEDKVEWFRLVQSAQDEGTAWGKAVEHADKEKDDGTA